MGFPNHTSEIENEEEYEKITQTLSMYNPVNKYDYRKRENITNLHEYI